MKKVIKYLSVFLILVLVTGCSLLETKTKEYSLNGVHITMEDGMKEEKDEDYTVFLSNDNYIFSALKESITILSSVGLDENSTVLDYTKLVLKANDFNKTPIEKDGLTYYTYDSTVEGTKFFYSTFTYKTEDAFWLVNFACLYKDKSKYESKFIKWAKTIQFD